MATTLAQLLTRIAQKTGDSTNPTSSNAKRVLDLNDLFDDLSAEADFEFAKKKARFVHVYDPPWMGRGIEDVLGITDLKEVDDVRLDEDHTVEFEQVKPDYIASLFGLKKSSPYCYAVETFGGKAALLVNYRSGEPSSVIDTCDTVGQNGADWTAGGGVSSITVDTTVKRNGDGSVKFNLSSAGSGYLEKTQTSVRDLRDYTARASFRMDAWLPTGSAFSQISVLFGNDSSNYYTLTATTQHDGSAFQNGWNRVDFSWTESTTATGTVDLQNVDYFRVTFTHTGAQTGVRIDDFRIVKGTRMKLVYFTDNFVKTQAGTLQARFSTTVTTTEQLLGPDSMSSALVSGCVYLEMGRKKGWDDEETVTAFKLYEKYRDQVLRRSGVPKKKPQQRLKPRSYWS